MSCLKTLHSTALASRRLNLGVAPLLEKNLEYLNDCLDDLMVEQGKLSMHQNQLRRQQQAIAQFKMQRRQENMARRAAGAHPAPLPVASPCVFCHY